MSHPHLNVILTGTDNPYLKPPVKGEIELFELGLDGTLIQATFRRLEDNGRLAAPVEVKNPTFTYDPQTSGEILRARRGRKSHP